MSAIAWKAGERIYRRFFLCAIVCSLAACASPDPLAVNLHRGQNLTLHSTTAAVSSTVVRAVGDNRIICAQPQPDASISESEGASVSIALAKVSGDEQASEQSGENENSLGGRDPNVLITRELLFRQCEFLGNSNLTDQQKIDLYNATLSAIVTINQAALGDGTEVEGTPAPVLSDGP